MDNQTIEFVIITVSDSCSKGLSVDLSGPGLAKKILDGNLGIVKDLKCVPDEQERIEYELVREAFECDVILTTGGTGLSPRDVTPEATKAVIDKEVPAFSLAMTISSLSQTKYAILSRSVCGIRGKCLIVNLPGSVKGSSECFDAISHVLKHAVNLLRGDDTTHQHQKADSVISKVVVGKAAERPRESTWPMLGVSESQDIVMSNLPLPAHEFISLSIKCVGRIVSQDISSVDPLPPFRASIKDGYAVISREGAGRRVLTKAITAGMSPEGLKLVEGECARVNTGGPIPENADAVVQVEDTKLLMKSADGEELEVEILVAPELGQDIRTLGKDSFIVVPVGSDIAFNETVLKIGDVINSIELGLLATIGITKIPVYRLPRVGVLSTGNEVVEAGVPLRPGLIRDSNRITLLSLLQEHHFPSYDLGIVIDEPTEILHRLSQALSKSDVILTTGGVSMGERDYLKAVITEDLGATIHFARLNMKPGKPTTFATLKWKDGSTKMLFCLPGNPVSATVTFHLYVLPALRAMAGHTKPYHTFMSARLGFDVLKLDTRPEYRRAVLDWNQEDGIPVANSTGNQISSRLMSWREANGLILLPSSKEVSQLKKGTLVKAMIVGKM